MRFSTSAEFGQHLSRFLQLGMLVAMRLAHFGNQLAQPGQLLLEELVMGGLQVIPRFSGGKPLPTSAGSAAMGRAASSAAMTTGSSPCCRQAYARVSLPPPQSSSQDVVRIRPIDDLRSAVIVLVVAHHAALAYIRPAHVDPEHYIQSSAPVVDPQRWWPLDVLVSWNDHFFMSLLFLLSGLFVLPALRRKGIRRFLLARAQRLGLPFLVAASLLSPLAFYPSWWMSAQKAGLPFWQRYYGLDGWSPGPAWFLWLLLAFSLVVALGYGLAPAGLRRWSWQPRSSLQLMLVCLASSGIASGAMALLIGPDHWFTLVGPLSAQTSRLLLYAAWFLLGVVLGAGNLEVALSMTLLRPWREWAVVGALVYLLTVVLQAQPEGLAAQPPLSLHLALAFSSATCGTFTILAALGFARSHLGAPSRRAESLRQNSYGIFLLHYPLVTWTQFALLGAPLPAALKFLISFGVALGGSWLLTIALRQTPVGRVI